MDVSAYLSQFRKTERITEGMSGDEKYRCLRGGSEYLLRIADGSEYEKKKREYEHLKRLGEAGLPVPGSVEFSGSPDSKVFTLLTWVPGEEAERLLPQLSGEERYGLGLQAGETPRSIVFSQPKTKLRTPDITPDALFFILARQYAAAPYIRRQEAGKQAL